MNPRNNPAGTGLRFLSIGAGAIGAYIGGSLALHGFPVVFLERPERVAALQQAGVALVIAGQPRQVPGPQVFASLEACLATGAFDCILFAVKSFDTETALEELTPYRHRLPPILCLQNGVENEARLAAALGENQVIPGSVTSSISRGAGGEVILERLRGVGLAGTHSLIPTLLAALNTAGLNAQPFTNPADMKWSKMLTNLLANATSAILDMTPGEVFAHPRLFRLELAQLRETLQVMKTSSIHPVDLPGTPVRALAYAVKWLPSWLSRPLLRRAVGGGRGGKMPSFHIDLYSGREQSEVSYLNGAVVRAGQRVGVPTPTNRLLDETLSAMTAGRIALDEYRRQPQKLLFAWENAKSVVT
ncbi:MAG: 2-dehydropantoate 2-reductase [Anaerolineales bacterium]|nr:2-dehydropantoate 2-reductase [Anaerolineales bacterium]